MASSDEERAEGLEVGLLPKGLNAEQLRILAYGSAMGREFDFRLLVAATGGDEENLAEEVEKLTQLGVLRERPGGDRFTFAQDETRARVYRSLTASRLRVLHRKIAEAMERTYPQPPVEVIPEMGRHYFLGKVPEKSYHLNRRAAALSRQAGQPEAAAHHLERARIDLRALSGDHNLEEAGLAEELGNLYYLTGDLHAADRMFREGLEWLGDRDLVLKARLLLARSEAAREGLELDTAIRFARQAHELFSRVGDLNGVASIHRVLGRVAHARGAYREALDEGMRALDLLQQGNDLRVLGEVCIDIGNAFAMLGPEVESEAISWYERAIDRLRKVEDWAEVARAYHNMGVLVGEKRPVEGLENLARCRESAERAHEPRWAGWSLFSGVEMRLALGQVEEAERDNQQAGRLLERADDPLGLQQVEKNEGLILEKRGQWEEGEAAYRRAIERARKHTLAPEEAESRFLLARLLFKTRSLDRAREELENAKRLDLPHLRPSLAPALAELDHQVAQAAAGQEAAPSASSHSGSREAH